MADDPGTPEDLDFFCGNPMVDGLGKRDCQNRKVLRGGNRDRGGNQEGRGNRGGVGLVCRSFRVPYACLLKYQYQSSNIGISHMSKSQKLV